MRFINKHWNKCIRIITKKVTISLQECIFSDHWKTANLRPLIKQIGPDVVHSNHRPMCNLNFISKVVKSAMLEQVHKYCKLNDLIPNYQLPYRAYHSCETALVKIINDILWNMENKQVTIVVSIDLSAAFDTVDHQVMIAVVETFYGTRDPALQWFWSYLKNKKFKVKTGNIYSTEKLLSFSMPQGFCLGVNEFCWYSGTLIDHITESTNFDSYADDHTINKSFNPVKANAEIDTLNILQNDLWSIHEWMNLN